MSSWVIVEKATNKAIFETFSKKVANAINRRNYEVMPILAYLQSFNKGIKND